MSKQRGKKWQLVQGPLGGGGPSHGTTGTMVNPALIWPLLWLIYLLTYSDTKRVLLGSR